ncbi:carboxypeptidase regulatory-like domain-containing protein [Mesotoga sp.]|uniref:InlB B-repeat-containing protein n=1 Tax=Mesotoga sp. TaxID=2053577 RepID=UPI00345E7283
MRLIDGDLVFYSLECLGDLTFAEKVELLVEVILENDSYVVIQSGEAWIWDFATYPNNPKYDLTQDTLDTLGLPDYALAICEGELFNILNGKSLYLLVVEVDPEEGGEVEVDPDQILYEEGTEVSLTAVPASAEWLFGSWSGDLISTDPVETIVMDEDKVITANFYEAEDPYVGEPDEMVVCSGEEFSIVVPGDADEVEITFDGVTKAAVEDPEGLFTATFTAPTVAKDVTRAISIKAVKGPKEKSWTWEDKVTVKAVEVMVINEFYVEDFDCGADETEIVVITCCFPEPDLINSFIAIEYSHSGEIEYLTDPEVTPLPGCEVELRYNWEFPRTECTDATVTAFIKSQCSEYVTETVVVEGIAVLDDEDVIEIGIDPLTIPCNATEVTFPVKINYSLDKLVEVFVDACRGEIISGSIATLLETGEETFTVDYSDLDCREACFAVNVVAEDCEGCPQEFEICYYFDLDNVPPEAELWLDLDPTKCINATSTTVYWEVTDRALSEISIEVSDGNLVWWEDNVKKTGKVYYEYIGKPLSIGDILWEFDPWCGDLEITLTATDFCGEGKLCESDCCKGLNKNTTVVSKTIFIDNIAPVIELIGIPDQICEGNTLTFDWILEDCQLATVTKIGATMLDFTTDATFTILSPWKDGISTGTATVTWEGTVTCGELTIEIFGVDECGNGTVEKTTVPVNTAKPEVTFEITSPIPLEMLDEMQIEGLNRICDMDEVWIWYGATACMEEMKLTVSRGCFDSKETPCGRVKGCDEWIWKRETNCEYPYVVLKLPKMDCEELVVKLTGVDVCGRKVEYIRTYIVDNIAPDIELDIIEPDVCATSTTFNWDVRDRCLDEVSITVSHGTLEAMPVIDSNGAILVGPTGQATWTFEGIECEDITLTIVATDSCGNTTIETRKYRIDNVGARILYFGFVDEEGQPIDRSDMSCDDVYTTDLLYLTWDATDNCEEDAVLTVDLGFIEEYVYDEVMGWIWVDRGQEELVPWSSDGSKWRWNVEDQDCYYGTIALEVFDSCDSDSTETTILVDNVAPDFWFDASIEECSEETCITISWTGYDRCTTCGTGDCGSWDIGKIFFSHPDVNTEKDFANLAIDTCICEGPEYSGTVTWCFGNLDCETLVATIVGWDSAGNMSEPWGMEIGNTDTVPPVIEEFSISELMFEGEIPYVELTWEATDNCFDFVNVWVNQGSFQKPLLETFELELISFIPPEPWTAFQKSKSWTKTVKWYLEDPEEPLKAWIAAYDFCCNEATGTVFFDGFLDIDVRIDGEGEAGDSQSYIKAGTEITVEATASACWEFKEWQDDEGNFLSSDNPYTFILTKNITLVAVFEKLHYKVTMSATPSGAGEFSDHSGIHECGTPITLTATPTGVMPSMFSLEDIDHFSCYEFLEWQMEDGAGAWISHDNPMVDYLITHDATIVAVFARKQFQVTLEASPTEGALELTADATYLCGEETTVQATPTECYDFAYWLTEDATTAQNPYSFTVKKTEALTAVFTKKQFDVSVTASPTEGGIVDGNGTYLCGESVTVQATPTGCYRFINWTEDGSEVSTSPEYQFTIGKSRDLVANFEQVFLSGRVVVDLDYALILRNILRLFPDLLPDLADLLLEQLNIPEWLRWIIDPIVEAIIESEDTEGLIDLLEDYNLLDPLINNFNPQELALSLIALIESFLPEEISMPEWLEDILVRIIESVVPTELPKNLPFPFVKITVKDADEQEIVQLESSCDGSFSTCLPPGSYTLLFEACGYKDKTVEVTIQESKDLGPVSMVPNPGIVGGLVTDSKCCPLCDASVKVLTAKGSPEATTGCLGLYDITGIEPLLPGPLGGVGVHVMRFSKDDYETKTGNAIFIAGLSVKNMELAVVVTFEVTGSGPLKDVEITIYSDAGRTIVAGTVTTNSEGKATIVLPEGDYWFTAVKTAYEDYEGEFTFVGAPLTVSFEMLKKGTIKGTVKSGSSALNGVLVTVKDSYDNVLGTATTAIEWVGITPYSGRYSIEVPAGADYTVTFEKTGYASETEDVASVTNGEEITLDVDLTKLTGKIEGYVWESRWGVPPVGGVTVTVLDESDVVDTTVTNGIGIYAIDVPPGTYTVRFEKSGYTTAETENVVVTLGGTTTVNKRLYKN